jgi:hypothetical protein
MKKKLCSQSSSTSTRIFVLGLTTEGLKVKYFKLATNIIFISNIKIAKTNHVVNNLVVTSTARALHALDDLTWV